MLIGGGVLLVLVIVGVGLAVWLTRRGRRSPPKQDDSSN